MRLHKGSTLNFILWNVLLLVLCGAQTTWWNYVFGSSLSPALWLLVVIYLILYRRLTHVFFYVYFAGFVVSSFSAMPLGTLLPTLGILTAVLAYVKSRFFWPNTRYFVIASFSSVLFFHILLVVVSHAFESNPAGWDALERLVQTVMTTLFAMPMYWLLRGLDKWTWSDPQQVVTQTTGAED